MAKTDLITAERLRELLNYDPDTGVFTWRVRRGQRIMIGDIAGTIDRDGYRVIRTGYKTYRASRLAYLWMKGEWPPAEMDHRNTIPADDRWRNLRPATRTQNVRNVRQRSTNPFKGITWNKAQHCWRAQICVNYRVIYLGSFDNPEDAHAAYLKAAMRHFGSFTRSK